MQIANKDNFLNGFTATFTEYDILPTNVPPTKEIEGVKYYSTKAWDRSQNAQVSAIVIEVDKENLDKVPKNFTLEGGLSKQYPGKYVGCCFYWKFRIKEGYREIMTKVHKLAKSPK